MPIRMLGKLIMRSTIHDDVIVLVITSRKEWLLCECAVHFLASITLDDKIADHRIKFGIRTG